MNNENNENQEEKILTLKHIFGIRVDIKNPVLFFDETTVLFGAGNNLIQQFISGQNNIIGELQDFGITALDVHINKKLIAIAEKGIKGPFVHIYELSTDLKRKKKLCY
ncbi:hypothetical protein RFI_22951 [Reticulomyxa filosa]|uniref:Uncharacterized protein n=1 Tax=Reticulomyxa filosa TaxID=46433 RepID=X6MMX6_RETFI|nr:hypothetical protein RFI_22951 [Reticulomyxa filosa]|eukprot:ETO14420.1 hypothetical protein RFI_22951 [Reticulomyxa filosa]